MLPIILLALPVLLIHWLMRKLGIFEGMHTLDFEHFCPCSVTP